MRLRALIAATLCLAPAASGCGAPEPQAPAPTAATVAEAISGIAQACGEHAQLSALPAFGPAPARERAVLGAARMRYAELEHAVSRNPSWIYQGRTLEEVKARARGRLLECGLGRALG